MSNSQELMDAHRARITKTHAAMGCVEVNRHSDLLDFLEVLDALSPDNFTGVMQRRLYQNAAQAASLQECGVQDLTLAQMARVAAATRTQMLLGAAQKKSTGGAA